MALPSTEEILELLSDGDIYSFDHIYKGARELEEAEKSGDVNRLKEMDFGVAPMCIWCSKPCLDPATKKWRPMKCGGCQAIIYCSRACQITDWKTRKAPNASTHKELCASNKEHMKLIPYFKSELEQFPWARTEFDGTCSHDLLKACFGVLGSGKSFGYWSTPGGFKPHDASAAVLQQIRDPEWGMRLLNSYQKKPKKPRKGYVHGEVLLDGVWPTDVDAWNLKNIKSSESVVPWLHFPEETLVPEKPQPDQVRDWQSWYEWRGLSLVSPAALIMDYPMSVYHLLVDVLKVVDVRSTPEQGKTLEVHYIGAEVELNFLPLFSELALLLPNMHINLTMFGKAARDLVLAARKSHPGSLATRNPIWSYTAPKKTGGGSIDIRIYTEDENWTRLVVQGGDIPDVMVGMNAGLLSYPAWTEVMVFSAMLDIPFGVTEYCEQSADTFATAIPMLFTYQAPRIASPGSAYYQALVQKRTHPIKPNPFHRVGQRTMPCVRMPNYYNGFSMPVVMGRS